MKKLLLIVFPLLLIVGCSKPISEETLIDKDGLKYHPETKELYSGEVFQNRMDGGKEFEGSYMDGLKNGLWTGWYENGNKRSEKTFKDGTLDGLYTSWYDNGQKETKGSFKDKFPDGLYTVWYKNGQKAISGYFESGEPVDIWAWWDQTGKILKKQKYPPKANGITKHHKQYTDKIDVYN